MVIYSQAERTDDSSACARVSAQDVGQQLLQGPYPRYLVGQISEVRVEHLPFIPCGPTVVWPGAVGESTSSLQRGAQSFPASVSSRTPLCVENIRTQ